MRSAGAEVSAAALLRKSGFATNKSSERRKRLTLTTLSPCRRDCLKKTTIFARLRRIAGATFSLTNTKIPTGYRNGSPDSR